MIKYITTSIFVLFILACSNSDDKDIIYSDKIRLIYNDNPSESITIGWNQYVGSPILYYGLTKETKNSLIPQREVYYAGMNNTFARVKSLTPDYKYYFKICTNSNCSEIMYFKTAPLNKKAFTFIAGGDSRGSPIGRERGNILISKIRPLFIIHGGDYTKRGTAFEWQRWLDEWQKTKSSDGRVYPLILTYGNHENSDHEVLNKLFDVPNSDSYFKIDFDFLSIYTLNTELEPTVGYYDMDMRKSPQWHEYDRWDAQTKWLQNELKKDTKKWKIVSYHRPIRPHRANKDEGRGRYLDWSPLFYKYGVKLAIECDSHLVKYTKPLKPDLFGEEGFVVDEKRGTTFIGEGSWGAPIRKNDDDKSWTIQSGSFWQFKLISATPNKLEIRTIKFGDKKHPYNPNQVEEINQTQQDNNPTILPKGLDLWDTKIGKVLKLK